ncbi:hypothetical protein OG552_30305 [Streptomyces sp. NBC_01476]|uniref:hypothetical protein n=1 Tax=Streptomyces sp. NBC_01476 TaxID=2903881 RepID=UPI002E3505B5|nr:hypothetical protein [Streptomyces sp. NBC_01476]
MATFFSMPPQPDAPARLPQQGITAQINKLARACCLTSLLFQADVFGEGFDALHRFPELVAWCWPAVL